MYCFIKSEEVLFADIEQFSPLLILVQQSLAALARVRRELMRLEQPQGGDFVALCREFEALISALNGVRDEIGSCDADHLPALLFLELSPAMCYVLRRVRKVLPPVYNNDPIQGVLDKWDEIKDLCRPEKREEPLTNDEFRAGITRAFEEMVGQGKRIAALIRSYDADRKVERAPTAAEATLGRLEQTADDTNEIVHRVDNRERRANREEGRGAPLTLAVQRACVEWWRRCQTHPEWFGAAAHHARVTKQMAYELHVKKKVLSARVDSFKTFLRAIDSGRKLK